MREREIQTKMQRLVDLHHSYLNNDYQLSKIDIHSIKNLIEQLHIDLITINKVEDTESIVKGMYQIQEEVADQTSETDTLNNEIDEVFNPPSPIKEEKVILTHADKSFQLGINERIMFAKELFDDDVTSLTEKITQLKSFENSEIAFEFFDNKLAPFLIDEGKDEEIIHDFRSIITRIYS